jgi:hypothetical protein
MWKVTIEAYSQCTNYYFKAGEFVFESFEKAEIFLEMAMQSAVEKIRCTIEKGEKEDDLRTDSES